MKIRSPISSSRRQTAISCWSSATATADSRNRNTSKRTTPQVRSPPTSTTTVTPTWPSSTRTIRRVQQAAEFGVALGDGTGNFTDGGLEDLFLPLGGDVRRSRPAISITTATPTSSSAAPTLPTPPLWCCWVWATDRSVRRSRCLPARNRATSCWVTSTSMATSTSRSTTSVRPPSASCAATAKAASARHRSSRCRSTRCGCAG